ncbi:MAG: C45 family autoproteolytic acyltransferase/hydrolase [Patescibacteria group bacterium]|nr:MAG: C45 family autoproteolytic acyltransferase/hydrolase [Patescibacteria group bacterium]
MIEPIRFAGSVYDGGVDVGRKTAAIVRSTLERVERRLLGAFGGDHVRMRHVAHEIARKGEEAFPASDEFLQGLARGTGIDYLRLIVLSFSEEVLELGLEAPRERDRCSTLAVRAAFRWLVGHQEDYKGEYLGSMIVTDLAFTGYPRMVGVGFPGQLPGNAGMLNEAGVFLSNDALWCAAQDGFPKQSVQFEACLQVEALTAALCLMKRRPALTDHFLIVGTDTALSLEIAPPGHVHGSEASLLVLGEDAKALTHANSVKRLLLKEPDPAPPGSRVRQALLDAIAELDPPQTFEAMQERMMAEDGILNRTAQRNWTMQQDSVTLASVIADLGEKRIAIVRYRADGSSHVDEFRL